MPEDVAYIIKSLQEHGFEAYAVGGCVRDSILGREPEDWDITTSALPQEVKKIFRKTVDTGIEHGTVTVLLRGKPNEQTDGKATGTPDDAADRKTTGKTDRNMVGINGYEVTTYRIDGDYADGRHPDSVAFTPSLLEDLKRRDFTINAMAYNEEAGLVDEFGGIEDLKEGVIRCVGDPDARFSEDALRILRALRFAAQLDFCIAQPTEDAIGRHVENLDRVSKERIQTELSKLLCSAHPERVGDIFRLRMQAHICPKFSLVNAGIFSEIKEANKAANAKYSFPEIETESPGDGFSEIKNRNSANGFPALPLTLKYLRYAILTAGMQETDAETLLKELKLDNDTIKKAAVLSDRLPKPIPSEKYAVKKAMQGMTPELFKELLSLKKMFRKTAVYQAACGEEDAGALEALLSEILQRDEPVYLLDLVVRGSDLIAAGIAPGPKLGMILEEMLDDVQREPVHNSVLYLLSQHAVHRA